MLFGLGVIGGLNGPDLGVNAPNVSGGANANINGGANVNGKTNTNGGANTNNNGEATFDGVKYPSSSVTVETQVL